MEYSDIMYGTNSRRRSGVHFNDRELREILISIAVMTVAFYMAIRRSPLGFLLPGERVFLFSSFLAVTTAFFGSLIVEKRVATDLGAHVEYAYSPMGLVIAFVTGFIGFVVAMPGRTMLYGGYGMDRSAVGRIFFSGILTNVILAVLFMALFLSGIHPILMIVGSMVAWINIILSVFGLIPFRGTPGYSVYEWSKPRYFGLCATVAVLAIVYLI